MNVRKRANLAVLFGLLVVIGVAILSAFYIVTGPVIPRSYLRQLKPGMTKSEVSAILGPPPVVQHDQAWVYSRWGNAGWVEVYFDGEGRFDHINDESPIP